MINNKEEVKPWRELCQAHRNISQPSKQPLEHPHKKANSEWQIMWRALWNTLLFLLLNFCAKCIHEMDPWSVWPGISCRYLCYYQPNRQLLLKVSNKCSGWANWSIYCWGIENIFFMFGIMCPLFSYLHHNSQSLIIIFVYWTQLLEYWSHDTNYMLLKI